MKKCIIVLLSIIGISISVDPIRESITSDTTSSLYTHCVRIYSRALSSDEIAVNYLIDRARYVP